MAEPRSERERARLEAEVARINAEARARMTKAGKAELMRAEEAPMGAVFCERLLWHLKTDEDFRWEFVSNGIDSSYVKGKLGLKGRPSSKVEQERQIAGEELELTVKALEGLVRNLCQ